MAQRVAEMVSGRGAVGTASYEGRTSRAGRFSASRTTVLILLAMAAGVLLLPIVIACTSAPATVAPPYDPLSVPPASLPDLLPRGALPNDEAAIEALLATLPVWVANRQRGFGVEHPQPWRFDVSYGEVDGVSGQAPIRLLIWDAAVSGVDQAVRTAGQEVAKRMQAVRADGRAFTAGRSDDAIWVLVRSPGLTLVWGAPDGGWVYLLSAPDQGELQQALIALTSVLDGVPPACLELENGCAWF